MGLDFPFDDVIEPEPAEMARRGDLLESLLMSVTAFPLREPGPLRPPRLVDLTGAGR